MKPRDYRDLEWAQAMVRALHDLRGLPFDEAWLVARERVLAHGVPQPRPPGSNAYPKDDRGWLPFMAFFKRACEQEWAGTAAWDLRGLADWLDVEIPERQAA